MIFALSFCHCFRTGESLPFERWKNLEKVDLAHNQLKTLPESFSYLVQLKELDLSENELTDDAMTSIPCAPNLKMVILQENQLKGRLGDNFTFLTSLERLCLSNNEIDDDGLSQFPCISSQVDIDLSHNPIYGRQMEAINKLPKIKTLNLSGTFLSDDTVDNIDIDHRGPAPEGTLKKTDRHTKRAPTVFVPRKTVSDEKIDELNKTRYQHGAKIMKSFSE